MQSILLVEDSKILQLATKCLLAKAGYEVFTAEDGQAALDLASINHPDVILLDMMLPKLSGPEVLCRLKQNPETADIPVIVLSGLSQKNEEKLRKVGAADFVGKENLAKQPEPLFCAIKDVLEKRIASILSTPKAHCEPPLSISE
ncbi:MAG TPA: response regulator [Candidatus Angelobacter sp.]|jgi:CheY-like chemotaxis protein|nr:response regulator [Candidatus Angelobacter sp.]